MTSAPLVFLVDDQPGVRKALSRLLTAAGLQVLAFESAQAFLDSGRLQEHGCLVLDLSMPGMDGLTVQQTMAAMDIALPIVFLTGHGTLAAGITAMKHGALDFLSKPVDDAILLAAVRAALERDRQSGALRQERERIRQRLATLTPREKDVLDLVVTGLLNKQVAARLGTAEKTIKAHRAQVMSKMQAGSLAELVRLADRARAG